MKRMRQRRFEIINEKLSSLVLLLATVMLSACAMGPTGPSVKVMPGPGVPFEKFQADDAACRQWAQQQIGGASLAQVVNQSAVGGAVIGTLVGAGLGAAIGGATGDAGTGAAIGGATGLVGGAAIGSNAGATSADQLQNRYDIAYQQCMYSKGHQTPAGLAPQAVNQPTGEKTGASQPANQSSAVGEDANSAPLDMTKINFNDGQRANSDAKAGKAGVTKRNIMEAQRLLNEKGYDVGTPDGRMGSKTQQAIRNFQRDKKIKITGTPTQATMDKLREP